MENVCKQCATALTGRRDQYCSDACRKAHKRSVAPTETVLLPVDSMQTQFDKLTAQHESVVYKMGVLLEIVDEVMKEHPKLSIDRYYQDRVMLRRIAKGELDQVKKHFPSYLDQKADK